MDTEPPKQVLTAEEMHEKILQLVHQVLGPEAITLDGQADVKNLVGDMRQDLQRRCTTGSSRKKMGRILKRVDHYFKIIDVAIQHQARVTALVWAGVRTIVQISLNHLETLEDLEQAIDSIGTTLLMAEFYYSLYGAFVRKPPENVRSTELLGSFISILPGLYADVVVFMVKAKGYFESASMTSAIRKLLVPFCLKFKPLLDGIMEKEAVLRKLMENAAMAQMLENAEDLQLLKRKLDKSGDCLRDNWKRLVGIEEKLSRVIEDNEKERLIKCRMWLRPLQNPDAELNSNLSNKTEGTCTWILDTEEFGLTIEGDDPGGRNHLWIEGKPGAGKSVLLSYLVYTTRDTSTRMHPVLHFFCKDASSETSTAAAIVANLIDQLVTQTKLQSLFNILSTGREEYANSTHCTNFAILWGLFLRMVREFPTRIIIFVDALDECSEKERSAFMGALLSLPDNACLCLTSRGLPDIERTLQDQEHQRKILKLEMRSQEDIIMFLNESINRNRKLHCHREKVMEKVAYHARGMFRYAALLVGELIYSPCQNISAALESPPADLNEMYETILLRLDTEPPRDKPRHRTQRKRILQWATVAIKPLKPSELAWSCAIVDDEQGFDPESVDIDPQELIELCSPLLEIVDGCVHFTHLSAKEFLLQKPEDLYSRDSNRREQIAFYLVDNIGAHVSISTVGVALSRHVTGVKVKGCYPVTYWPRHAQNVATSQQMSQDIQRLWDRVSRFLVDSSLYLAWTLEFPWEQVLRSVFYYYPTTQPHDFPHVLHIAAHYGLDEVLNRLLSTNVGVMKLRDQLELELFGGTPLLYAISGGFSRAVQRLLDFGVKTDTRCGWGTTPLGTAAGRGNEKITQLLLDHEADVETRGSNGRTPLSYAVFEGSMGAVRLLLDRGADIETRDDSGQTPLSLTAQTGRKHVMELLLDRKAEIETRDNSGQTPLQNAVLEGFIDVVWLLLDRGANIETRDDIGQTPLSNAAASGDIDIVQLLLDHGADIETRDDGGWTPLSYGVLGGYIGVAQLLLERGAKIETRDNSGWTPLSIAVERRGIDVVQLLLKHGAKIETRDNSGRTPLSIASERGWMDVAQSLLDHGAEVETRGDRGCAPLSYAVLEGFIDVVLLLLDRGADIETRDGTGQTPLSNAAASGDIDVVQLLLDRGAEIETRDGGGWTPLSYGVLGGSIDVAQLLLNRGAKIETRNDDGRTPLSNAAGLADIVAVQLLLDRGADIETRDDSGRTPLSHAAKGRAVDVVKLLLEYEADTETRDNVGRTPLSHAAEFAASHGCSDVICFLLAWPTTSDSPDDSGLTAIGWAETVSEELTGSDKIVSEDIVAILKAVLL